MKTTALLENSRTGGAEPVAVEVAAHGSKIHVSIDSFGLVLILDTSDIRQAVMHDMMDDGR